MFDTHDCDVVTDGLCHALPRKKTTLIDKKDIFVTFSNGIKESRFLGSVTAPLTSANV